MSMASFCILFDYLKKPLNKFQRIVYFILINFVNFDALFSYSDLSLRLHNIFFVVNDNFNVIFKIPLHYNNKSKNKFIYKFNNLYIVKLFNDLQF